MVNKIMTVNRFFAWLLFVSMLLFFISGYGMTKGLFDSTLAVNIHNKILPPLAIFSFTVHSWYSIHLAFKRWRIWNFYTNILLLLFFISFISYFGYIQYFYKPVTPTQTVSGAQDDDDQKNTSSKSSFSSNSNASNQTTSRVFNKAELAKYNGKNGNPSYVAVDGVVYDVTRIFVNGFHFGHYAGNELSNAFYLRHAKSAIRKYPVVGTYKN